MRRFLLLIFFLPFVGFTQTVTVSPAVPNPSQPVTITVDVTGTSLQGFAWNNTTNPVWIWAWLEKGAADVNAPTNVNPATSPGQDAAKCTRISVSPDVYQITFTPTVFFGKPAAEITKIGLKLKSRDWNDNKQTDNDRFFDLALNFSVTFSQPSQSSFLVNQNDNISITANTNAASTIAFKINGTPIATSTAGVSTFTYVHQVTETEGSVEVVAEANNGSETKTSSFRYTIRSATVNQTRPSGIIDGINYHSDQTKVTLGLLAPGKSSVYVLGDFNDWAISADYKMKKDGEHFWLEIDGLTPNVEYGFQYLVDEVVRIADPFADKILDPDDQYIPATTYPSLKPYPDKALRAEWYFNRVSVFQTGQTPYNWQVTNFTKPAKEKLVVYELLVRDFFEDGANNYQSLIDTISYFKNLGINAIELMPIMEFGGNNSWGYNPQFMFAPDKAYGTKNKLKEFIDVCHQNGIAVIFDIAMNHQDTPNPYLLLDFNYSTFKPNPTNKFFNVEATHPFSVFYDMNHESAYTKKYLDTINYYWLHEYKIDGYRFDLSKGFTQVNNPNNVGAWSAYDASRIAILKRMADKIWANFPDAYVILEHLAVNSEEKELAEYRSGEGKGMMLWGNLNNAYLQSAMGYASDSDFGGVYYGNRSWSAPRLVSYMESHDEERMIYKNLAFGNTSGTYTVKDLSTALKRARGAATIFYTIPGPKMLWQFGELGYDYSINYCEDGTISDGCRTYPKPVVWDYLQNDKRVGLKSHISDLLRIRNEYDVFTSGSVTLSVGSGSLEKQLMLKNNPYTATPASTDEMNVVVVVNFDVIAKTTSVNFPHTGTWYDYYANGTELNVSATTFGVALQPGEYKLFTDVSIGSPEIITGTEQDQVKISLYPNPASRILTIVSDMPVRSLSLTTMQGVRIKPPRIADGSWDISQVAPGLYVADVETQTGRVKVKVIKQND
ncbi:MAG: alpha-amylase family glycosyl hydrolase [Cyclobacteriaceae bacterium]